MTAFFGPLLIFCLRIIDVPAGTIRVIYMVRGQRVMATLLSFIEASAYIFAVVKILQHLDRPINILAYAAGYAAGTFVGITLERWIATGWIVVRIASRQKAPQLAQRLRDERFGVTILRAEGREGELSILFIVAQRRRLAELLKIAQELEPDAFLTIDPVTTAIGGYLPNIARPAIVGK